MRCSSPARSACGGDVGQPLGGVRHRRGARPARPGPSSRAAATTVDAARDLVARDRARPRPTRRRAGAATRPASRRTTPNVVHLVLVARRRRACSRVLQRRLGLAPSPSARRRGCRARAPPRGGRPRRRRRRAPRAASPSRAWSMLHPRRAEVDQRVGAGAARRRAAMASSSARSPHAIAALGVLAPAWRAAESAAVGAGELDRLAERLEDRDRLEGRRGARRRRRRRTSAGATGSRVQRPTAASSPSSRVDRDRALDRREGVVDPADERTRPRRSSSSTAACSAAGSRSAKSAARR